MTGTRWFLSSARILREDAVSAEKLGPDVPLHFSAFHPDYRMLDKPRTPQATLSMARRIAMRRFVQRDGDDNWDRDKRDLFCSL